MALITMEMQDVDGLLLWSKISTPYRYSGASAANRPDDADSCHFRSPNLFVEQRRKSIKYEKESTRTTSIGITDKGHHAHAKTSTAGAFIAWTAVINQLSRIVLDASSVAERTC